VSPPQGFVVAASSFALVSCGGAAASVPPSSFLPVAPEPVHVAPRASLPPAIPEASAPPAPPPPPTVDGCPGDMVAIGGFCVDRYEAPNVKGELPFALQTAYDGEAWCAERGKRLCTQDEWVRACEGPKATPFPYGATYRDGVCDDDKGWITVHWKALARWPHDAALDEATRLFQADMSGARAGCVSAEGVYDLAGNVAEWVRKTAPTKPGYDHVLKGCYWAACFKDAQASCTFTNGAHPGTFRTYEAGFRCCTRRVSAVTSGP
jgi:formylglycine-generating enzyme required for sulfatase activity